MFVDKNYYEVRQFSRFGRSSLVLDEAVQIIERTRDIGFQWRFNRMYEMDEDAREEVDKIVREWICKKINTSSGLLIDHRYKPHLHQLDVFVKDDGSSPVGLLQAGFFNGYAHTSDDLTTIIEMNQNQHLTDSGLMRQFYSLEVYDVLCESVKPEIREQFDRNKMEALYEKLGKLLRGLGIDDRDPEIIELYERRRHLDGLVMSSSGTTEEEDKERREIGKRLTKIYSREDR